MEPPGPIPNPEVKRCSADGSGTIGPVRVGRRQVFAPHLLTKVRGSFFIRYSLERNAAYPSLCRISWQVFLKSPDSRIYQMFDRGLTLEKLMGFDRMQS